MDEGIVQFRVSVTEFVVVDEEFESFGKARFGSVVFGQWGHELRVLNDEGWVETLGFEESTNKLVNKSVGGSGFAAVNVVFFALCVKELSGFFSREVLGEWLAKFLFEFFHHGDSSPWGSEIDLEFLFRFGRVWVELDFVAATDFLDHF